MTCSHYQKLIQSTWNSTGDINAQLSNCALGLGEAGELQGEIKKIIFHGHGLTAQNINKIVLECGDVLYYLGMLCNLTGQDLSDVMEKNIAKLRNRYPNGFQESASINRVEED